jgi:hypothetical protein
LKLENAATENIGEEDESDHPDDVCPAVDTSLQIEAMDEEGSESDGRTADGMKGGEKEEAFDASQGQRQGKDF